MKHALELTKSDTLANQARPHAHTRAETPTLSPSASPARQQPGQPSLTASPRTGQRDGRSPWTPVPLAASSLSPFSSPALVARTRGDEGGAGDAEAGGGVIARGVGEIAGGMGMGFIGAPPHCSVDSPFGDTDATSNRGPGCVVGLNQITDDSSLNAPAGVLTTVLSSDPAGSLPLKRRLLRRMLRNCVGRRQRRGTRRRRRRCERLTCATSLTRWRHHSGLCSESRCSFGLMPKWRAPMQILPSPPSPPPRLTPRLDPTEVAAATAVTGLAATIFADAPRWETRRKTPRKMKRATTGPSPTTGLPRD